MSEFVTHVYSARAYTNEECIFFGSSNKDITYDPKVQHIQVSGMTQDDFDMFVQVFAHRYRSIYFFQNPDVKDLSALACLKNVEYLLFYNMRQADRLWDMTNNLSLKGILISESKRLIYDISAIAAAPALEELLLLSSTNRKHTVRSLEPIKENKTLKRVMLECKMEKCDFEPSLFSELEVFKYRVDKHRNFSY